MKINNKAFTLVELLAVLVVLAAIILIVSPVVLNVIDNSENKTSLISAELYMDAVELAVYEKKLSGNTIPSGKYKVLPNGNLCIEENASKICINELEVKQKGSVPVDGYIEVQGMNVKVEKLIFKDSTQVKTDENGKLVYVEPEVEEESATDPSCFTYIPNYDYDIGDGCATYLETNMGSEDGMCSKPNPMEVDLIEILMFYDPTITIEELVDNNVVILKEELNTFTIMGYELNGSTCTETDVVVPSKIDGKPVTKIGLGAFMAMNPLSDEPEIIETKIINSVKLPDTVTEIAFYGFAMNQLKNLSLGNGVTKIGPMAFSGNILESVTIPDSVKTIEVSAFESNELKSVTIGDNVETIGAGAFASNKLTSVTIGNNVKTISSNAFKNNLITTLTIGSSVETIENSAFSQNQLTSVIIPDSVTTIGSYAFETNKLTNVTIGSGITRIGSSAFGDGSMTDTDIQITWGPNQLTNVYIDIPSDDGASIGIDNYTFNWKEGYSNSNIRWKDSQ